MQIDKITKANNIKKIIKEYHAADPDCAFTRKDLENLYKLIMNMSFDELKSFVTRQDIPLIALNFASSIIKDIQSGNTRNISYIAEYSFGRAVEKIEHSGSIDNNISSMSHEDRDKRLKELLEINNKSI